MTSFLETMVLENPCWTHAASFLSPDWLYSFYLVFTQYFILDSLILEGPLKSECEKWCICPSLFRILQAKGNRKEGQKWEGTGERKNKEKKERKGGREERRKEGRRRRKKGGIKRKGKEGGRGRWTERQRTGFHLSEYVKSFKILTQDNASSPKQTILF